MTDRLDAAIRELVEALREDLRTASGASARMPDRLLSIPEAAAALGVSRTTLYERLIGQGQLRIVRAGRRVLVPTSAIAEYAARDAA